MNQEAVFSFVVCFGVLFRLFKVNPLELISKKQELLLEFSELLTDSEKLRALNDPHSKKPPRWCGITVHFTVNCPFRCAYCYIEDMGFSFNDPRPYSLSGKELAYALLSNPTFLLGRTGTLLAIGAVSEPFIFFNEALDKISWLARLGNPIQFSTKQYISSSLAQKLANISLEYNAPISPLITIITLQNYDALEKYAPPPEKRFDSIKNLRDAGLRPVLFLRPIIPGVNLNEIEKIVRKAKDSGAVGVVVGGFRVTTKILERLESEGINTREIKARLKKIDDVQRNVPLPEKKNILRQIRVVGLIPWASACCANSWNANVPCPSACFISGPCTKCPNMCSYPNDCPDAKLVEDALLKLGVKVRVHGSKVKLLNYPFKGVEMLVRNISRRPVIPAHRSR